MSEERKHMPEVSVETPGIEEDESSSQSFVVAGYDWAGLVNRIKRKDEAGVEDLYRLFHRGIRFFLCRQLGPQELEDKVHDTF